MAKKTVVFYTSCPPSFDYPWTKEVELAGHTLKSDGVTPDRRVRKVEIDEDRYAHQVQRYWSGGVHLNADPAEWAKLVGFKLVTVPS